MSASTIADLDSLARPWLKGLGTARRAQGRYAAPDSRWPLALFVGASLMVGGTVLLFH